MTSTDASATLPRPERNTALGTALISLASLAALGLVGFFVGSRDVPPQARTIKIVAHQYGYDPPIMRVNEGDTVKLTFTSQDVVHGFYLEGYDLDITILPLRSEVELRHPSRPDAPPELVKEVTFVASREGKFRYRCSHTCGFMHPFMLGELIVGPNRLLPTSIGMLLGLCGGTLGGAFLLRRKS